MTDSDLTFAAAHALVAKIKTREITSRELTEHFLGRVDQHNETVNAIVAERREFALKRADAADAALERGEDWRPLHGLPMTVKESYAIEGMPSTWGAKHLEDNIATANALAIQRLEAAGAVIFGKTNVPLMLADFQSYNDVYGTTNNPWRLDSTPGGSSGGSAAALASGMSPLEAGSDIGGSIRNPAHFCGVFGHKPTWNMLPPRGHAMPGVLTPSDISVIGPLARSARDLEIAVDIMAGPDEIQSRGMSLDLAPLGKRIDELNVAVWRDDEFAPVDASVAARVDLVADALANAGAQVDWDARPVDAEYSHTVYQTLLTATMASRTPDADYDELVKAAAALDPTDDSRRANQYRAQTVRFRDWNAVNEQRTHLRWAWHEFFGSYDFLITPIMANSAFPHMQGPVRDRFIVVNNEQQAYFTQLFWAGLTGAVYLPSTIIPTGPDNAGLPIGVQIIGPEYSDRAILQLAQYLETQGFAFQAPPAFA